MKDLGVAIHGQSFAKAAVTDNLALGYPSADSTCFNIGLLHTGLTGLEGHDRYAPCTIDHLRSKEYQYWALGHIHMRQSFCENPPIVFPGNLQGRHAPRAWCERLHFGDDPRRPPRHARVSTA